ncbi:MAG TPA: histidinol-phosphate transaminase [Planctomycetaceae bacterium]|nr:histidinol-phosphate transaminase [Planctomycetaceae bacterium]
MSQRESGQCAGLFRPDVERIAGYTPGEQPQETGWIKLNTNENPYPPSPRVIAAIQAAAAGRLNVYPDPLARRFCQAAAKLFGVDADWILPANGSDENLTILMRAFVDPGEVVASPYPSYILYETLADIQGARHERLLLASDWSWDHAAARRVVERSKLVLVPNPNSPSGNQWPAEDVLQLVPPRGVLVLDEAYGDFCDRLHRCELLAAPNGRRIVITRSLSKSYSLAGLRFGFAVAHPELIRGMRKVKDSYNCDTLAIAGAVAAIADQAWMQENTARIRATRGWLTRELRALGFDVVDSQANFVWATRPEGGHRRMYEALKERRILVRYMQFPEAGPDADSLVDGLRISIGTDEETDPLLEALRDIVG